MVDGNDWAAAAAVVVEPHGRVLAVSRGMDLEDLSLPGGNREAGDRSAEDTATRELFEETGLVAIELIPILHTPRNCMIFFASSYTHGPLVSSAEGLAMWVEAERLVRATCRHAGDQRLALELTGHLAPGTSS